MLVKNPSKPSIYGRVDEETSGTDPMTGISMIKSNLSCIRSRSGWLPLAIVFFVLSTHHRAAGNDVSVWGAGCTEKIQDQERATLKHDCVWDANTKTIRLEAVRGEHVPFQVVITTRRPTLKGIRLSPSRLVADGNEIPADKIKLYLAQLVNVYTATKDHGSAGRWPDPLVPLVEPFDMQFYWHSQRVNQQSIWVELEIPHDQAAGIYRGSVEVSCEEGELDRLEVEITVHDLQLPERRSFPVHIGLNEHHIAWVHGVDPNSEGEGSLFYPGNLARQYSGQPNVEGPIGSLRLALLREGLEELELLQMLTRSIGRDEVEKMISPICSDIRDFSRNPNQIDQVRSLVIRKLLAHQADKSQNR